jgi:hypothetical protein
VNSGKRSGDGPQKAEAAAASATMTGELLRVTAAVTGPQQEGVAAADVAGARPLRPFPRARAGSSGEPARRGPRGGGGRCR